MPFVVSYIALKTAIFLSRSSMLIRSPCISINISQFIRRTQSRTPTSFFHSIRMHVDEYIRMSVPQPLYLALGRHVFVGKTRPHPVVLRREQGTSRVAQDLVFIDRHRKRSVVVGRAPDQVRSTLARLRTRVHESTRMTTRKASMICTLGALRTRNMPFQRACVKGTPPTENTWDLHASVMLTTRSPSTPLGGEQV